MGGIINSVGNAFNGAQIGGRLTLVSATPVTTSDQTAKVTLYYTPYIGNDLPLIQSSDSVGGIKGYKFSELSLSLSGLTASKVYDVFVYDNGGTLTLESLVWTNTTTRATTLSFVDGLWVKSTDNHLYLGSFYTTGTGTTELSLQNVYVWNAYNQVPIPFRRADTAGTYTIAATGTRQMRNSSSNQCSVLLGLAGTHVDAYLTASVQVPDAGAGYYAVIGDNSTSVAAVGSASGGVVTPNSGYSVASASLKTNRLAAGLHNLTMIENVTFVTNAISVPAVAISTNSANVCMSGWVMG
jgi:hypothetical protein